MKNLIITAFIATMILGCKNKAEKTMEKIEEQTMAEDGTEKEIDAEWITLFDGTSFDGWKGYLKEGMPDTWKIEDGAMVYYPPKNKKKGESYNLVTKNEYTDFVLSLEWKISEGGNSGIMWGVKEDPSLSQPYRTGPEIQILDNDKHPDGKNGTTHQAGALYDMVAPSKDVTQPVGEWNTMVVTIDHRQRQGSVVLNDEEVVTFPVGGEIWDEMVAKSKFADWEHFGKHTTGKIALQDHGDGVSFRNIKIKEL